MQESERLSGEGMKVQILSTSDGQGGAAKAAFRLNGALRAAGVDCVLSTLQPTVGAKGVVAFPLGGGFAGGLERVVGKIRSKLFDRRLRRSRPPGSEIYSIDRTPYAGDFARWRPEYDLINLHWVGRFVDIAAFFSHHPDQPVAWTLHDMNPFTGGCHYDSGCGRFTQGCGRCPELGSGREDDLSAAVFRRKKTVFDALPEGRLHLVTPSRWLAGEAGRSALFERFPVTVIPNGIDTGLFAPADRDRQRRELGIAADAKVVLFAAQAVDAPRKGFLLLVQALGKIDAATSEGLLLLSVGGDTPDLGGAGINHRHLGFMNDENAMNAVYGGGRPFGLAVVAGQPAQHHDRSPGLWHPLRVLRCRWHHRFCPPR